MKILSFLLISTLVPILSFQTHANDYNKMFEKAKNYSKEGYKKYKKYKEYKKKPYFNQKIENVVNGSGKILWVYDGDTFKVQTSNRTLNQLIVKNKLDKKYMNLSESSFRVRLSNIDTGESVHYDKSKNTKKGKESSNYAKATYNGQKVTFQCFQKGKYGRAVCSVQINNQDIGLDLISKNHSTYVDRFFKHPTMHKQYKQAELKTKQRKK